MGRREAQVRPEARSGGSGSDGTGSGGGRRTLRSGRRASRSWRSGSPPRRPGSRLQARPAAVLGGGDDSWRQASRAAGAAAATAECNAGPGSQRRPAQRIALPRSRVKTMSRGAGGSQRRRAACRAAPPGLRWRRPRGLAPPSRAPAGRGAAGRPVSMYGCSQPARPPLAPLPLPSGTPHAGGRACLPHTLQGCIRCLHGLKLAGVGGSHHQHHA